MTLPKQTERVKCPECGGSGDTGTGYPDYDMGRADCLTCNGTGEVPAPPAERMTAERASFLADSRYVPAEQGETYVTQRLLALIRNHKDPSLRHIAAEIELHGLTLVPAEQVRGLMETLRELAPFLLYELGHKRRPEWHYDVQSPLAVNPRLRAALAALQPEQADHGIEP